jgi:predicted kinase
LSSVLLIVFGGLPGVGKTTIAREVAARHRATYLRIDHIEQAIRSANVLTNDVGPAGYMAAYALAKANLDLGQTVVADCVNPLAITRAAWRSVTAAAASPVVEIEVICSDAREHRKRVENRIIDIPELIPPSWASVMAHDYEPWSEPHTIIDTACVDANEAAQTICILLDQDQAGD